MSNIHFDYSQLTKVRNFPRFSNRGDFLCRISKEFLTNHFLVLIPRKISKNCQKLVPKMRDMGRIKVLRNSWEILQNYSQRNFWEFLRNTSLEIPEKFSGLGHQVYGFLGQINKRITFLKIPKNFSRILRIWSPS